MGILWRRLMRRLGRWVQMIGLKIEDKGYISHDTSKDYDLGRGTLFSKMNGDKEWTNHGPVDSFPVKIDPENES